MVDKMCLAGSSSTTEMQDLCSASKWYTRDQDESGEGEGEEGEGTCVSNHPHVARLVDKTSEYAIKPLDCGNE